MIAVKLKLIANFDHEWKIFVHFAGSIDHKDRSVLEIDPDQTSLDIRRISAYFIIESKYNLFWRLSRENSSTGVPRFVVTHIEEAFAVIFEIFAKSGTITQAVKISLNFA